MKTKMDRVYVRLGLCAAFGLPACVSVAEDPADALFSLSLRDLINTKVIVASRTPETVSDAPGIISIISRDDIKKYGARHLHDVLRRIPGLTPQSSVVFPSNLVSIRGQHSSVIDRRTLLLLNGKPFNDTNSGGSNTTFYMGLPLIAVERIEVIRGPGSVLYGTNAFSGVVNVITLAPDDTDNKADDTLMVSAGSFGTVDTDFALSRSNDLGHLMIAGQYTKTDGWEYIATDNSAGDGVLGSESFDESHRGLTIQASLNAGDGEFVINGFSGHTQQEYLGINQQWPGDFYDRKAEVLSLGYHTPLGDKWRFEADVTYNHNKRSTDSQSVLLNTSNTLYEMSLVGEINEKLNTVFGLSYHSLRGHDGRSLGPTFEKAWKGAYWQIDYRLIDNFKLIAGIQHNDIGTTKDNSFRSGLIWRFQENWGFKLLYGEAFRSPYQSEVASNVPGALIGNAQLQPETIATIDAQLFYHAEKWRMEATIFDSTIDHAVGLVPYPGGGLTYVNGSKIDFEGLEIEGRAQLSERWFFEASYSYQSNTNAMGETDRQIEPNTMFKLGLTAEFESGITIGLFNHYYGEPSDWSEFVSFSKERNPNDGDYNYLTVNVNFALDSLFENPALRGVELSLYADNLLASDAIYGPDIARFNVNAWPKHAERAIYGRVRFKF